ncbi:MAG: nucleotide exchange factor GrpE [Acidobacteria bacterium]|nr:MAG: nucleotide exchange factor GrpE [Acidobacteriota bacterium]
MDRTKTPPESTSSIPFRVTDRRPNYENPSGKEPQDSIPEPRHPSLVVELEERARAAEAKLAEGLNLLRRREAEADDFRARLKRESERRSRAEMESWLNAMLEVMDSLDRGAASAATQSDPAALREGILKVRDQFLSTLARQGVEPMVLVGTPYDPHLAEAVEVTGAATPSEDNTIVEEVRRGYQMGGQVLRPAQVRVARIATDAVTSDPGSKPSPLPES